MELAIADGQTNSLVADLFQTLPDEDCRRVISSIVAVTDAELTTAVRPFGFGGKVVHELHFNPSKLKLFSTKQRTGAVLTAFAVCCLTEETSGKFPLSNQILAARRRRTIAKRAIRWNRVREVSSFLNEVMSQERERGRKILLQQLQKSEKTIAMIKKKMSSQKDFRNTIEFLTTTLEVEEWMARSEFKLFGPDAGKEEKERFRRLLSEIREVGAYIRGVKA